MKCFVARWRISSALNGERALSESVTRHIACCAACRRFHANGGFLNDTLGGESGHRPPAHLHTRVMASVREAAAEVPSAGLSGRRLALSGGLAALALLVLGIVVWQNSGQVPRSAALRSVSVADVGEYGVVATRAVSDMSVTMASPMSAEMDKLRSDIASVGGHLLACLE